VLEEVWQKSNQNSNELDLAGRLALVHDQLHKWDRAVIEITSKRIKAA
jgi:hypothetical protein